MADCIKYGDPFYPQPRNNMMGRSTLIRAEAVDSGKKIAVDKLLESFLVLVSDG